MGAPASLGLSSGATPDRRRLLAGLSAGLVGSILTPATAAPDNRRQNPAPSAERLVAADGAILPLRVWPATDRNGSPVKPWAVIVALHGFDDDAAEAFLLAGPQWSKAGVTTYAYDQRGFGRAPGRGRWAGASVMANDLRTACKLARQRHPDALLCIVGESMGGAVAINALTEDGGDETFPQIDRLVLLSPAVWGWRWQPLLNVLALRGLGRIAPGLAIEPPSWMADVDHVTDNAMIERRLALDPDEIQAARLDTQKSLVDLMQDAAENIGRVSTPTLYLYGAHDTLIPRSAALAAVSKLGRRGRSGFYRDGWHLLDRDRNAGHVLNDVVAFIKRTHAPLPSLAPPISNLTLSLTGDRASPV